MFPDCSRICSMLFPEFPIKFPEFSHNFSRVFQGFPRLFHGFFPDLSHIASARGTRGVDGRVAAATGLAGDWRVHRGWSRGDGGWGWVGGIDGKNWEVLNKWLVGGLEPWIFYFSIQLGMNHNPKWRSPWFFRGVETTNQMFMGCYESKLCTGEPQIAGRWLSPQFFESN